VRRSAGSGRRRAVTRALPLVAAGATPLRVAASTAVTAAAVLGRPRLGRGDTVQCPALEVGKERVAAVGHAQEPGIEAGQVLGQVSQVTPQDMTGIVVARTSTTCGMSMRVGPAAAMRTLYAERSP
jgi:hypothetical protein